MSRMCARSRPGPRPICWTAMWCWRAGGAMGYGCGPVLVARKALQPKELRQAVVAVPGARTTAAFLLDLSGVRQGSRPARRSAGNALRPDHGGPWPRARWTRGLLIHEERFTYKEHGLRKILDLGKWWETATGFAPAPGSGGHETGAGNGGHTGHGASHPNQPRPCPPERTRSHHALYPKPRTKDGAGNTPAPYRNLCQRLHPRTGINGKRMRCGSCSPGFWKKKTGTLGANRSFPKNRALAATA